VCPLAKSVPAKGKENHSQNFSLNFSFLLAGTVDETQKKIFPTFPTVKFCRITDYLLS
jgi:hypothetical protein